MTTFNLSSINSNLQRIIHHIWDPEPRNETPMEPIFLLGVEYCLSPVPSQPSISSPPESSAANSAVTDTSASSTSAEPTNTSDWPKEFLDDFSSRVWLTYRSSFPPIPRTPSSTASLSVLTRLRSSLPEHSTGFTSDEGWGCMIRSAQCVLANTLSILHFSRSWRRGQPIPSGPFGSDADLLRLFADSPDAPFSIHRFVDYGERFAETEKGQWFGPQAAATTIERLVADYPGAPLNLAVYVSKQDTVYMPALLRAAYGEEQGKFTPTLVLVHTRLGINGVTQVYWESLKNTLKLKQSVGIAGGRPRSSHYFLGVQADRFVYMDPHITRPALRTTTSSDSPKPTPTPGSAETGKSEEGATEEGAAVKEPSCELDLSSCYTTRLRMLRVQDMDPSMMIAFLIRSEEELKEWREAVKGRDGGKAVVNVVDAEVAGEREGAVDEVESFSDDEEGLS